MSSPRHKSIQQNALGWVKKSIDDTLGTSESDLKLYIENRDPELIADVISRLQTLQGVLVMVEQFGAAMLTEEMVSLAEYIQGNDEDQADSAMEVLLRAVLQLPDYLEHIQSGQQDNPIVILPILNDIRAVRNQDLFSEKLLFLPDLSMHQDIDDAEEISKEQNEASKLLVKKVRPLYQMALLSLIKEQAVEDNLKKMARVFETLEEKSSVEQTARIWWIISALIESLILQQLELGVSVKNLLGKVDALFRVMLIIGEQGLLNRQPIDLIKNFLYYIGQPECDGPKAQAIKTAYRLEQFLPTEAARSRTLEKIAGPNQALLKTVAEAIKVDIEAVKSTLEVYVNSDLSDVAELKSLPDDLRVISDTLAMIGLGPQRELIKEQIEIVEQILAGDSEVSDNQLLTIAGDMLQIEQALDHLQRNRLQEDAEAVEVDEHEADEYEMEEVLASVVTAALDNIQRSKDSILDFIQDSSSDEKIKACLPLLEEAKGAMRMLNQQKAVSVIDDLLRYLAHCDIVDFMEASRLDALSQVVASIEYYLEALGEHRSDAENILEFAEAQMVHLLTGVKIDEATDADEMDLEVVDEEAETPTQPDLEVALQVDDEQLDEVTIEEVDEGNQDALSAEDLSEVLQTGEVESLELEIESPAEPSTETPAQVADSKPMELDQLADEPESPATEIQPAGAAVSPFPGEIEEEIQLESLEADEPSPAAAEPSVETTDVEAVEIGQLADEAEIEDPDIEALPVDDIPGTEEAGDAIELKPLEAEHRPSPTAGPPDEIASAGAAEIDQLADEAEIENLDIEALPVDDIPDAEESGDAIELKPLEAGHPPSTAAEPPVETASAGAAQIDQLADESGIEDLDIEALPVDDMPGTEETGDATELESMAVEQPPMAAAEPPVETSGAGAAEIDQRVVESGIEDLDIEALPADDIPGTEQTGDAFEAESPFTGDVDSAAELEQLDAADTELKIDFDDAALDQEAEEAVLESHDEFASPMELLAEQAANQAAEREAGETIDAPEAQSAVEIDEVEDDLVAADEPAVEDGLVLDAGLDDLTLPAELEAEAEAELDPELAGEAELADIDADIASVPELEPVPEVAVTREIPQQAMPSMAAESAAGIQAASAASVVVPVDGNEVVLKPDVDQDILEIYLEEADEEAQNILDAHQKWKSNADDQDALSDIRRAFHTIKGSGRLVGAVKIGEFAWDYENLLNRVIDRSLPVSDAIISAVGDAGAALTELVTELKGGGAPQSDIPYLRGLARSFLDVEPPPPLTVKESIEAIQKPEPEEETPAIEETPLVDSVPAVDELAALDADLAPDEEPLPSLEMDTAAEDDSLRRLKRPISQALMRGCPTTLSQTRHRPTDPKMGSKRTCLRLPNRQKEPTCHSTRTC